MKKSLLFWRIFLLSVFILATYGCPGDPTKDDYLFEVNKTKLDFPDIGGKQSFDVMSNREWTAVSSDQSWCVVSPSSGDKNTTVDVNVAVNTTTAERTAVITVKPEGSELKQEVTVTQAAGKQDPEDPDHTLTAAPAQLDFLNTAGTKTLQITANVEWTVVSNEDWCTVSSASGTGVASVEVTVTANTGTTSRFARLTVSNSQYSLSKTIGVTQQGVEPSILISPDRKDIGAGATTIEIAVSANVEFDVTSNAAWLTVTQATAEKVTLQAQANTTTASRTGTVTFKQRGGSESKTLTVNQAEAAESYIAISPDSKDIGAEATTIDVTVSANVEFDVTPNVAWITVSQATATSVTLQAQANTMTASRTGTVTFKQKGGSATATLTVNQAGSPPEATIYYVSPAGNDYNDGKSWNNSVKSINTAIYLASAGGQVWVEEGAYSETVTMKEGVNVYGGFNRSEKSIADRGTRQSNLSNAFSMPSSGLSIQTVLDGFFIVPTFTLYRNGVLNNCTINTNFTVSGGTVSNSTITLTSMVFSTPRIGVNSDGKILNCRILCNIYATSTSSCAGIDLNGGRLEGCMIAGNISNPSFLAYFIIYRGSNNYIVNCTFYNITNNILAGTPDPYGSTSYFYTPNMSNATLNFVNNIVLPLPQSLIKNKTTGFYSAYNLEDFVNNTVYYLNVDYSPMSNSPAVNAGSNSFVTLEKDILGNPRIQNGTVDIGAIESAY